MRLVLAPVVVLLSSCTLAPFVDSPSGTPAASGAPPPAAPTATAAPIASSAAPEDTAAATAAPTATLAAQPGGPSAPTPYTAAQIRGASPAGRRIVFRVEAAKKPASLQVIEFVSVDADGAEIRTSNTDLKNKVLETKTERSSWEALRLHALFPNAEVTIARGTNPGPLGPLECIVYKVTDRLDADTVTSTFYFAQSLPGPPVFMTVEKNGVKVRSMAMETNSTSK